MPPKLFSFTQFRKNASATPLVSHTFKTTIQPGMVVLSEHREPKDPSESCKPFRLIHFRKNASATPFVSHTSKKMVGGPSVAQRLSSRASPRFLRATRDRSVLRDANHNPRITGHQSRITTHFA